MHVRIKPITNITKFNDNARWQLKTVRKPIGGKSRRRTRLHFWCLDSHSVLWTSDTSTMVDVLQTLLYINFQSPILPPPTRSCFPSSVWVCPCVSAQNIFKQLWTVYARILMIFWRNNAYAHLMKITENIDNAIWQRIIPWFLGRPGIVSPWRRSVFYRVLSRYSMLYLQSAVVDRAATREYSTSQITRVIFYSSTR